MKYNPLLGCAYVPGEDGPEAVDLATPRASLIEAEAGAERDREQEAGADLMKIRVETMRGGLAWILGGGPHPAEVAVRLVAYAEAYAPRIVEALSASEVAAVAAQDRLLRERCLMRLLVNAPRLRQKQVRDHAQMISAALAKAFRREGHTWSRSALPSDLEQLRAQDIAAGSADGAVRIATAARLARHIWEKPTLVEAVKHFYVIARGYCPALILNMTGEEVAAFFDQVRASTSEREKLLLNRRLERAGFRQTTLAFQKGPAACRKYARQAKGNHHRADSVRPKAAA